jgi:hypothetical protein
VRWQEQFVYREVIRGNNSTYFDKCIGDYAPIKNPFCDEQLRSLLIFGLLPD